MRYLPCLYLDTNVLISALLESDAEWIRKNNPSKEKLDLIHASREIYDNWDKKKVKISTYSVGEFISKGRTPQFKKTPEQMIELAEDKILSKFEILPASIEVTPLFKSQMWRDRWRLATVKVDADVIDSGTNYGRFHVEVTLTPDMKLVRSQSGGIDPNRGLPNMDRAILDNPSLFIFEAPAFEILMFGAASAVSIEKNVNLPDAIHTLYVTKGNVHILVTNDADFKARWNDSRTGSSVRAMDAREVIKQHTKFLG